MIEPLAAMRAACMAIADGDAHEIELVWRDTTEDRVDQPATEHELTITVRREVRHLRWGGGTETDSQRGEHDG